MNNWSIKIYTLYNIYKKKIIIFLVILFILNVLNFFDIINLYNIIFINYKYIFEFKDHPYGIWMKIANLFPILMLFIYVYFFGFNKKIFGVSFLFFFYTIINWIIYHKLVILGCEFHVVYSMKSIIAILPILINNFQVSAWAINMDIVNIEYLDLNAVISHLTFENRISIISKETLEIWFNNYTSQNVVLKDLYIPIQIDELLIEKILNSILKNEYLFLLSILVVVVGLTHLDPIGFFASIPGLNIILEFYTFGFFADVGEDNVRTRWELAIIKFLIMDIEICSFPFNNDSYIGYLINDPHVEQYLLYSIKAIYWIYVF